MKSTTALLALASAVVLAGCSGGAMSMDDSAEFYQQAAEAVNDANHANDARWEAAVDAQDVGALNELCSEAAEFVLSFGETLSEPTWPAQIETQVAAVIADTELEAASFEACATATDLEGVVDALETRPEHQAAQDLRATLGLDAE